MLPNAGGFCPTSWSLIAAIGGDDPLRAGEALETMCNNYWYPLYAYVRRSGHPPEDAADLTQGFFASLLENELLTRADPGRGRLRSYLLTCMQRFLRDDWRKRVRQKRGGGAIPLSIDEITAEDRYAREPEDAATPESLYHRRWALSLLECALTSLRNEYALQGKAALFDTLKPALTEDSDAASAAEYGAQLNMSPGAVRVAISRLRSRYRERLLAEVAASMDARTEDDLDEEIAALFRAFA